MNTPETPLDPFKRNKFKDIKNELNPTPDIEQKKERERRILLEKYGLKKSKSYCFVKEGEFVTKFTFGKLPLVIFEKENLLRPLAKLGYIENLIKQEPPKYDPNHLMIDYLHINTVFDDNVKEEEYPINSNLHTLIPYKYRYTMFCKEAAMVICVAMVVEEESYPKLSYILQDVLMVLGQRYGLRAAGFSQACVRAYRIALNLYENIEIFRRQILYEIVKTKAQLARGLFKDRQKQKLARKLGIDLPNIEDMSPHKKTLEHITLNRLDKEIKRYAAGLTMMAGQALKNVERKIIKDPVLLKDLHVTTKAIKEVIFHPLIYGD